MGVAATFKPVLHPRQRADGTHQVRVRVTKDRVSAFMEAGFTLAAKHWNPKAKRDSLNWVRSSQEGALSLNKRLDKLLLDGRETTLAHPELGAAELRDLLLRGHGAEKPQKAAPVDPNAPPSDFVAFAQYYVRERARKDKPNTVKFYRDAARSLEKWRAGEPLPFAKLSEHHLREFTEWLLAQPTIFAGTARDRLVKLSTIANRAEKMGLLTSARNPFVGFELPKAGNKQPPRRPTEAEQQAVLGLDISQVPAPIKHPEYPKTLQVRRDIWHLQYLIRGSRCGDVLQLRERDVRPTRISFTETKTGKLKNIVRSKAINAILARYPATGNALAFVFPALDHERPYAAEHPTQAQKELLAVELGTRINWVNDGLKALAKLAGVPEFTSHSARHMYGERAYDKLKDMRMLQSMFNHSHISTTERYLKTLGYDELDAATELVFE